MKLEIVETNEHITINDIKELESKFNVSFQSDYENFLLETNGGEPHNRMVFKSTTHRVEPFLMIELFSLERLEEILEFVKDDTEKFLTSSEEPFGLFYLNSQNRMIEIGMSYSNFSIYICYSKENAGNIYCADLIHDEEFILISNSFDEFINNFELVTEEEIETGNFHFMND